MHSINPRFVQLENLIHRELVRYSLDVLRVAVGAVFLGFGVLKFFPGVSPAQGLVIATTDNLALGLVPGQVALVGIAAVECFIGLCMLAGRWMRLAIWLLALELVGILSPLVLLPGRLFSGPYSAPTLEGQYVLKDVILIAAGMVIAAATFRGGRLVREEPSSIPLTDAQTAEPAPEHKLQIVISGMRDDRAIADVCADHQIDEATYHRWRDQVINGASEALGRRAATGPEGSPPVGGIHRQKTDSTARTPVTRRSRAL